SGWTGAGEPVHPTSAADDSFLFPVLLEAPWIGFPKQCGDGIAGGQRFSPRRGQEALEGSLRHLQAQQSDHRILTERCLPPRIERSVARSDDGIDGPCRGSRVRFFTPSPEEGKGAIGVLPSLQKLQGSFDDGPIRGIADGGKRHDRGRRVIDVALEADEIAPSSVGISVKENV